MNSAPYPGDLATPKQIYEQACEYHAAVDLLGSDMATAARLLGLQAIEGYLIAYARHVGRSNCEVREGRHDLVRLADIGADTGLALRNRVHIHLKKVMEHREYLVVRYGPEVDARLSQLTELQSTMNELRLKIGKALA